MRVCYFGTYDKNYPRNRIIIQGLRANGVDVDERHIPLWYDTKDKITVAFGGWIRLRFLARVANAYLSLMWQHSVSLRNYDAIILGYSGQFDALLARPLTRLWSVPLVLDVFVSIHLAAKERGLIETNPFAARMIYTIEKVACEIADLLFLDTSAYVDYFCKHYNLPKKKFRLVPLGANDRIFFPVSSREKSEQFQVLYFGKYLPLHGIDTILNAASLLKKETDIHFRMHGTGQLKETALELARSLDLDNVTFTGWLEDIARLSYEFAPYDVCLGAFGDTAASRMTIQNKIYEGLAMRKAVITRDSPIVRSNFKDREHIILCPPDDPVALADAIMLLKDNSSLCNRVASNGYKVFIERYTPAIIGRQVKEHLERLTSENEKQKPAFV
jgi:glycosyltransferase involved in cell wall biosynthesis